MFAKLIEAFVQANPVLAVAGWGLVIAMVYLPSVSSFVYGIFGKTIVVTAKPSAAVVEGVKQAMADKTAETPKV